MNFEQKKEFYLFLFFLNPSFSLHNFLCFLNTLSARMFFKRQSRKFDKKPKVSTHLTSSEDQTRKPKQVSSHLHLHLYQQILLINFNFKITNEWSDAMFFIPRSYVEEYGVQSML